MYQKVKRIIVRVLIIALIVGVLLYFVPWPTRVNLSLNAAKLNSNGEPVGQSPIIIKGWRLDYLFQPDQLDVNIQPFDYFAWIQLSKSNGKEGVIFPHHGDCQEIRFACCSQDDDISFCELLFTNDFKYVAFVRDGDEQRTYYVASADGQVSYKELAEYFRYLPPFG